MATIAVKINKDNLVLAWCDEVGSEGFTFCEVAEADFKDFEKYFFAFELKDGVVKKHANFEQLVKKYKRKYHL